MRSTHTSGALSKLPRSAAILSPSKKPLLKAPVLTEDSLRATDRQIERECRRDPVTRQVDCDNRLLD